MKSAKTILVIEDDPSIQETLQDLLTLEGYKTLAASNGEVGVQLALQHLPHLILCDVAMPEMDGYEVLTRLRQELTTRTIPFVFLTARTTKADLRQGMDLGADDYLAKPCTADELLRAISSRFEKQAMLQTQSQAQLQQLRDNISQSLPHELYTPLNGILGFSEVLFREAATIDRDEIRESAELIHSSALRLHHLMQNFLLYAKLELLANSPDQIQSLQSKFSPSAYATLETVAKQTVLEFERSTDLEIHHGSLPDPDIGLAEPHFQKIVQELVSNACKFSVAGPVVVQSQVEANTLSLVVSNQGRGMTAEQIANLGAYMQFERRLYEQQGAGLGLAIVKRLTELYGGEFQIQSQPGATTTVTVRLPLAQS
jgi:two-component system, sensor histidine kinase and response regulator